MSSRTKNLKWYNDVLNCKGSIDGVVEFGLALGGSLAIAALALKSNRSAESSVIYGVDNFSQLVSNGQKDLSEFNSIYKTRREQDLMNKIFRLQDPSIEVVKSNISKSNYLGKVHIYKDNISEIFISNFIKCYKGNISILKISCNWYDPVKAAMRLLESNEISLIYLDGYFHWKSYRDAVRDSNAKIEKYRHERFEDVLILSK